MTLPCVTTDAGVRESVSRDASGLELVPESVARPGTRDEVVALLAEAQRDRVPVTAAGGQTSTTAASLTDRGMLLSLRGLTGVHDVDASTRTVRVAPGELLGPLKRRLASEGWLLAPDPTSEEDCTVGGAIACNASGARSLRYGAIRPHVRGLTVALVTGEVLELRRTALEKNTVGYAPVHDLVDWFVGSEGTLGVILEAELALLDLPAWVIGLAIPFPTIGDALAFVVAARESAALAPRCLEFLDAGAFAIARAAAQDPGWAAGASALIYTELSGRDGDEPPLDDWLALAHAHHAAEDDIRVYDGEAALRDARRLRHAVPATMHERAAPHRASGGRRVSTDWAVPYRLLGRALAASQAAVESRGLEQPVTFGHAGNGHPHQNFIARDAAELERITDAVGETLREVIRLGGTVAAEHGIGKVKARWLPLQVSPTQRALMRAVKHELDPHGLLAPGNIL
ncbi:MAG: FAD-binding oxidoreductase [Gemmatimonadaceae bacterium]|nr:FAD-binding oxidoreductase [Gemmatimonadaceae bacterium]